MLRVTRFLLPLFLLILLSVAVSANARLRAVGSKLETARNLLIVTAHPDDEVLLAPLLAQRCIRDGARCSFLVMTRGEGGACRSVAPCGDLGAFRSAEMARAAAMFHAGLTQWSFPDVLTDVDAVWSMHAGGRETLLRQLRDAVALERPDIIFTFDPEHGTSGHEAHKTIAALLIESGAENLYLLETAARTLPGRFELSDARPGVSSVLHAREDWVWLVRDAQNHESQFTPEEVESLRTLDEAQRRVWWMQR
jgi:LmbE family N-acetylglucosaminyl deacetylase